MIRKILTTAVAVSTLSVVVVGSQPAAAKSASLTAYFPAMGSYPAGYQMLDIKTFAQPGPVLGDVNAPAAKRHHFVLGATRVALRQSTVLTITVARFRSATDAAQFLDSFHNTIAPTSAETKRLIQGLGSHGARYDAGQCVTCGQLAPPLGQLYYTRGPIFALIGIQPAHYSLATRLGRIIDITMKRHGAR